MSAAKHSRGLSAPVKFSAPPPQNRANSAVVDLPPPPRYSEDTTKRSSDSINTIEHGPSWISAVHAVSISTSLAPVSYRSCSSSNADTDSLRSKLEPGISRTKPHQQMSGLAEAASIFRYAGGGNLPTAWGKLRRDDELWLNHGDTLIFFRKGGVDASFRVESSMIEKLNSPYLNTLLREGFKDRSGYSYVIQGPSQSSQSPASTARPASKGIRGLFQSLKKKQSTADFGARVSVDAEHPVMYELHFPAPENGSRMDVLRFHITTRNFFAFLYDKPLVGLTFYQALVDLHERLELFLPADMDPVSEIIRFLVRNKLDDVRNLPGAAAGLLAWSERPSVLCAQAWREAFVHCVGMYDQVRVLPEYNDITSVTKKFMEKCTIEIEARTADAERRLSSFNFVDMWPIRSSFDPAAKTAFDRFARFLKNYFTTTQKRWPPRGTRDDGSGWLTRDVAKDLSLDIGPLYDYIVDREVSWLDPQPKGTRQMIAIPQRQRWHADFEDLQVTDLIIGFDSKHSFPNVPHPYPLIPTNIPIYLGTKKSRVSEKRALRAQQHVDAYAKAHNAPIPNHPYRKVDLLKAFIRYELSDQVGQINPRDGRVGRWLLLYAILQTIGNISPDVPNLRYTTDVTYHINPKMKGLPHWTDGDKDTQEANHFHSYCWRTLKTWPDEEEEPVAVRPPIDLEDPYERAPVVPESRGNVGPVIPRDFPRRTNFRAPPEW